MSPNKPAAAGNPTITRIGTTKYLQNGTTSTTQTVTSSAVTAHDNLILCTGFQGASANPSVSTVTDNVGGTWTKRASVATGSSAFYEIELWDCLDAPGGNTTVSAAATVSGVLDSTSQGLALFEFHGITGLQTPAGTGTAGPLTGIAPTGPTLTPNSDGALLFYFAVMFGGTGPTSSPSSPWTADVGPTIYSDHFLPIAYQIQATAGAAAPVWAQASQTWAAIGAVYL